MAPFPDAERRSAGTDADDAAAAAASCACAVDPPGMPAMRMSAIPEGDHDSGTETMLESDSDPEDVGNRTATDADAVFDGMIGDILMNVCIETLIYMAD